MFNEKPKILDGYKKFKKIMEDNKIWYSAYAGTAIGAVRDSGMIPWDDDVDTIVTYEGYKKLLEVCPDNIVKSGDPDYPLMFPKWVVDRSDILATSVFVDLFIIVKTNMKNIKKFRKTWNKVKFGLYATAHKNHIPFNKKIKVLSVIAKILKPFFRKQLDFNKAVENLYDPNGDIHATVINPAEPLKNILIQNFTQEVKEYKFEDTTIPVFKTFEPYLLDRYGTLERPNMEGKTIMEHLDVANIHFIKYGGDVE